MASTDGSRYPPIADYRLVGDLRSAALISRRGSVDWLWLPRFGSPSVFGRILDREKGGYLAVVPVGDAVVSRRYQPDSNVIETLWTQGRSRMRVVDFNRRCGWDAETGGGPARARADQAQGADPWI